MNPQGASAKHVEALRGDIKLLNQKNPRVRNEIRITRLLLLRPIGHKGTYPERRRIKEVVHEQKGAGGRPSNRRGADGAVWACLSFLGWMTAPAMGVQA